MRALPLLLLAGCGSGSTWLDGALWDPSRVAPADDGLYALLPYAGGVVRLRPGAEPDVVDLGDARATDLQPLPDASGALVRARRTLCEDEDVDPGDPVDRCSLDGTVIDDRLLRVSGAAVDGSWSIRPELSRFQVSPDGAFAVALVDPSAHAYGGGLVDLTAMRVIDLRAGADWDVSIGFGADRVEFLHDAAGATTGALVLSRNEVAQVDLTIPSPLPDVTFPLALDAGASVVPSDVRVTPDGEYALIAIQGSSDLYVLDLPGHAINILALRGAPSAMLTDASGDRTWVAYRGAAALDAIDHARFDVETWTVDTGFDRLLQRDGAIIAYAAGSGTAVWRIDPGAGVRTEFQLHYPVGELRVSPDGGFALTTPRSASPAFELLSLRPGADGRIDDRARPFGVDAPIADVAFAEDAAGTSAILMQAGRTEAYRLRWPELSFDEIELPGDPLAIGAMPTGGFYVTFDDALGRVAFLDADGTSTEVSGFVTPDLFREPTIAGEEE